ncbi:MAG: proton-conducting transporter membrane subunit [bacterium]|nr:proton-conducting transporter membrane subunit [bacterium]
MGAILPLLAVTGPLVAIGLLPPRARQAGRVATGACGLTLFLIVAMYPSIARGLEVRWSVPGMAGTPLGLSFGADGLGWLVALVAAIVWLAATLFAVEYVDHEAHARRYYVFWLLSFAGMVGLALAGDLLTLFLFFELMSLSSYGLVVHTQTGEAHRAGSLYLYLAVIGGLALLTAVGLVFGSTGSVSFASLATLPPALRPAVIALFLLGFGLKAGIVPLHLWLPEAHPVAPSPASAVLSGVMIKAGAYGILRVAGQSLASPGLGYVVIWLGLITMAVGVSLALLQANGKRLLAYHSVSQMGYIVLGIGLTAYLGAKGSMGLAGAVYHLVNHALFKALLFLAVGAVYLRTRELNIYRLGGLGRVMPLVGGVALIASLGISGFPGFNGYASKTLLHHALEKAVQHGGAGLFLAERLFVLVSAGTACSFLKLFSFVFLGRGRDWTGDPVAMEEVRRPLGRESSVGMGILAALILALGLRPGWLLERLLPLVWRAFPVDTAWADGHLSHLSFFNRTDLTAAGICLVLGGLLFVAGNRTGLFHLHLPRALSLGWLAEQAGMGVAAAWNRLYELTVQAGAWIGRRLARVLRQAVVAVRRVDHNPGDSGLFREMTVINLNFDVYLLAAILALLLLLYLPFGRA